MENKDDMKTLLDRFMDGQTTPEEEDRLARYFRSGQAPDEWRDYREMFAYFDEGMPEGRYGKRSGRRSRIAAVAISVLAVAAAVAFMVVVVMPHGDNEGMALVPMASAGTVASPDTVGVETPSDTARNVAEPSEQPRRRIMHKYKYSPQPPRGYLAEAPAEAKADTTADIDALVAEQIMKMEQRQKNLAVQAEMLARLREALVQTDMNGDLAADNEEMY